MVQTIDAIFEGGILRPLTELALPEQQRVRLVVHVTDDAPAKDEIKGDPFLGLRCDMGVTDFAENFDDYRLGRRQL